MFAWGVNVSIVKVLSSHLEALPLSAVRMLLALVCVWGICLSQGQRIYGISRRDACWVLAAGALLVYAHQIFLAQGLATSSATNGALILGLNPILSTLLGYFLFGEKQTRRSLIGITLGLFGAAIVVLNNSGGELRLGATCGDLALIAALFTYVIAGACIRRVSSVPPLLMGFYLHLFGALLLSVHTGFAEPRLWSKLQNLEPSFWLLAGISAFFSTALGNLAYTYGIATVGLSRASLFFNWLPISGVLFAVTFLHEPLGIWRIAGLACVVFGTYIALKPVRAR